MKKLLLPLTFIILFFNSCSDNDNDIDINITEANLVGEWKMISLDMSGNINSVFDGETIKSTFVGEAINVSYVMRLTHNPNMMTTTGGFDLMQTTTFNGETFTETEEDLEFVNGVTWFLEGKTFRTSDEEDLGIQIVELTDSRLVFYQEVNIEETDGDDSLDITIKADAIFEKL